MRHTPAVLSLVFVAIASGHLTLIGAPAPQAARTAQPDPGYLFSPSSLGFRVEYPKKDWESVGTVGSAVMVLAQKKREASVAIEVFKVPVILKPEEITDQTAKLEMEDWQARTSTTTGFTQQFLDTNGGRVIMLEFTQTGAAGSERGRLYVLPRGAVWYRVVCTAPQASFSKYQAIFDKIALSLTPTTP